MSDGEERIKEYEDVINLTSKAKMDDVVAYWARRGVITEATANMAYLKRRLDSLIPFRTDPQIRARIKQAIVFLRRLKPISESMAVLKTK